MKKCPFCDAEITDVNSWGNDSAICPNVECAELLSNSSLVDEEEDEDEEYVEIEVPQCFTFYDSRDRSCRRCDVKEHCEQAQKERLPECFGEQYDPVIIECAVCIFASQCVELQHKKEKAEVKKMARQRKVRIKRTRKVEEPVVEVVEEEEEVEEVTDDYKGMSVRELRAELTDRDLETKGRKSQLMQRLVDDDSGEDAPEEEEEVVVEEKPKPRRRRRAKKEEEPEEEVEVVEEVEEDSILAPADIFTELVTRLQEGQSFTFTAVDGGYQIVAGGAVAVAAPRSKGLRGMDFRKEVYSEEYFTHVYEDAGDGKAWKEMTHEERYAFADTLEIEWEEHDSERIDNMRMTTAVRKHLGIVKYKPEYKSKASREALK